MSFLLLMLAAWGADADLAGRYAGEWKSGSTGNAGAIRFSLTAAAGGTWKCDLIFTLDGADVTTVMREVKLKDGKVDVTYDFEVQGATLRSHLMADAIGGAFRGRYETSLSDGSASVDSGTWSAARAK